MLVNNALPVMAGLDACDYDTSTMPAGGALPAPSTCQLFAPYFFCGSVHPQHLFLPDRMRQPQTESYTAAKGCISALTLALR